EVPADGTSSCDLFVRHQPGNDHRIGEQHPASRFQDAKPFVEDSRPSGYMANRIIRKASVNGVRRKWQRPASIRQSKASKIMETLRARNWVGISISELMDIQSRPRAPHGFGQP